MSNLIDLEARTQRIERRALAALPAAVAACPVWARPPGLEHLEVYPDEVIANYSSRPFEALGVSAILDASAVVHPDGRVVFMGRPGAFVETSLEGEFVTSVVVRDAAWTLLRFATFMERVL